MCLPLRHLHSNAKQWQVDPGSTGGTKEFSRGYLHQGVGDVQEEVTHETCRNPVNREKWKRESHEQQCQGRMQKGPGGLQP